MRLTYLAVPFALILLAGCSDDDDQTNIQDQPAPDTTQEYNMPEEPRMPPASDTSTPPPADSGTGLGTEYGDDTGDVTDPATGSGSGTTQ